MSNSNYRVTVLVSYYNASRYMAHKLDNLASQTIFEECEFIFISGAPQPREDKLVNRFLRSHDNCTLIKAEERITLYRAWNLGIEASSAPLICNSNVDDVLAPNAIERLAGVLDKDKEAGVTFPNVYTTGTPNMRWGFVNSTYINTSPKAVVGPFVMWRRELHEKYGLFDERLWVIGDSEWWSRLRKNKIKFVKCSDYLVAYLVGSGLERSRDPDGRLLRVEDAKLLKLPKGSVEGY